jgi:hypothetical protein
VSALQRGLHQHAFRTYARRARARAAPRSHRHRPRRRPGVQRHRLQLGRRQGKRIQRLLVAERRRQDQDPGRRQEHGIDVDQWKNGGWKNWDKDKWLSEAKDFVNPVIAGRWKPERMKSAKDPDKTISAKDAAADQGVSDADPAPV